MKKMILENLSESHPQPLFIRQLSPQMTELLKQHFWCDFSDIISTLSWDEQTPAN